MADHEHHDGDTYFIDQLCMVGLSGGFGAVCLCLWFLQKNMLNLMLGEQFHWYVLASGFVLVGLALTRGAILWGQSKDPAFLHGHEHDHHDHAHDHAHAIHSGPPRQGSIQSLPMHEHGEACEHGHEHHEHAAGHHHHHDHDEADHDHGWAPWRYVVILVPLILFLLGLPNKPPSIVAHQGRSAVAISPETETYILSMGLGTDTQSQLVHLNAAYNQPSSGKGEELRYKTLEALAGSADMRARYKSRVVEVTGQYAPYQGTSQVFMLVRHKIQCCANDAVQLNVDMVSREPIIGIKISDWVRVTGRVDFRREGNGSYKTILLISKASDVERCEADTNPYIQ